MPRPRRTRAARNARPCAPCALAHKPARAKCARPPPAHRDARAHHHARAAWALHGQRRAPRALRAPPRARCLGAARAPLLGRRHGRAAWAFHKRAPRAARDARACHPHGLRAACDGRARIARARAPTRACATNPKPTRNRVGRAAHSTTRHLNASLSTRAIRAFDLLADGAASQCASLPSRIACWANVYDRGNSSTALGRRPKRLMSPTTYPLKGDAIGARTVAR